MIPSLSIELYVGGPKYRLTGAVVVVEGGANVHYKSMVRQPEGFIIVDDSCHPRMATQDETALLLHSYVQVFKLDNMSPLPMLLARQEEIFLHRMLRVLLLLLLLCQVFTPSQSQICLSVRFGFLVVVVVVVVVVVTTTTTNFFS